jgi:hypothetical protein
LKKKTIFAHQTSGDLSSKQQITMIFSTFARLTIACNAAVSFVSRQDQLDSVPPSRNLYLSHEFLLSHEFVDFFFFF